MIPTAVTEAERRELRFLAENANVLEVGSLLGYSTIAMAQVARHVVSVDPHEGYPSDRPRPTLRPFLANLVEYGVRDRVTVCVGTHADVLPWLARRAFHLAFIDCTGERELTLDAMRAVVPLLRHSAALCVHDCGHPDWPGALEAVQEFGRPYDLIDRLAVIGGTWG